MTLEAYYHHELPKVAMGWLGWTERATLSADVNSIVLAREGRMELLKMIFGSEKKESEGDFRDFAERHNARLTKKGKK